MNSRKLILFALAAFAAVALAACGSDSGSSSSDGGTISGAGSTFAAPVYNQWGVETKDSDNLSVNYNGIGSGGGIAQFTAGTVDFGGTDSAMKDEEVTAAEKKGTPLHLPMVFGAVTVSYNLPGVESGLKLDGQTLADIFQGKITKWNDPAITKLNPDVTLPSSEITVVHRSDESGTTALFTTFLDASSKSWASEVGTDKSVKWPTGTGAKGNDGVAGGVKQTEGSIGYVELAYALQNKFTTADVQNSSGKFVAPTLESTSAAGEGVKVPDDLRFSAINSPNPAAYPIASATFMLVYEDMCKAGYDQKAAENTKKFIDYGLGAGQDVAAKLEYAPLSDSLLAKTKAKADTMVCNGSPLG